MRVNVDVAGGEVLHRPGATLVELVAEIHDLYPEVEICITDVDRSAGTGDNFATITTALSCSPRKAWVGGGIRPERIDEVIEAGAAGVVVGVKSLQRFAEMRGEGLDESVAALRALRVCITVDFRGTALAHGRVELKRVDDWRAVGDMILSAAGPQTEVQFVNLSADGNASDWADVATLKSRYPSVTTLYGGGIRRWGQVRALKEASLGVSVGRPFVAMTPMGLSGARP